MWTGNSILKCFVDVIKNQKAVFRMVIVHYATEKDFRHVSSGFCNVNEVAVYHSSNFGNRLQFPALSV